MSNKVLGEITVPFDDGERTFKVRRRKYTEQQRLIALLGQAAGREGLKQAEGGVTMSAATVDLEKYAAFHIEVCRISLCDDEGKILYTADDIDEWGGANVNAVVKKLDEFFGPPKTTVDHAGN